MHAHAQALTNYRWLHAWLLKTCAASQRPQDQASTPPKIAARPAAQLHAWSLGEHNDAAPTDTPIITSTRGLLLTIESSSQTPSPLLSFYPANRGATSLNMFYENSH